MSKRSGFIKASMGAMLLATGISANAEVILYNDFTSVAGLQLNGDAVQAGSALRLTSANYYQSGSAFSTNSISLANDASFSSAFKFQITNSGGSSDGISGADGLVFVVQTVSNTAGGAGGGIGYQGLTNSVGVEFDTWNNGGWDDYNGNHVGINLGGNIDSYAQRAVSTTMNNGSVWSAWVDYNGSTDQLEVRLAEGSNALRPTDIYLSYTVDLTQILGTTNAFVGFTSGTGAAYGNHDVLAWQFNSTYNPITEVGQLPPVPEPETYGMMMAGLGLIGFMARRRKQSAA